MVYSLKRASYNEEIAEILRTLPAGLDEIYIRIFGQLFGPGAIQRDLALRTLEYIVLSRRPLTIANLDALLAIRPGQRVTGKSAYLGVERFRKTLQDLFGSIIRITQPDDTVDLVHLSIKDFLTKHEASPIKVSQAHERIAHSYLTYMNQPRFRISCIATKDIRPEMEADSLLVHAALSWGDHFIATHAPQKPLKDAVRAFLGSQETVILFLRIVLSTKAGSTGQAVMSDLLLLESRLRKTIDAEDSALKPPLKRRMEFKKIFEFLLQKSSEERGPRDLLTLQWYAVLGKLNIDYKECESYLRHAIDGFSSHPMRGPEHPETIATMVALGRTYWNMSRLDDAEHVLLRCCDAREASLGREDPDTLEVRSWLATIHRGKGLYAEACDEYETIIGSLERQYGRQNRVVMREVKMLGVARRFEGSYEVAEALFLECLAWCRDVLGEMHPDTVQATKNLAMVYQMDGQLGLAEEMHRDTIKRQLEVTGEDAEYFISLQNLGETLLGLGKFLDAEQVLLAALKGKDRWHGMKHPQTKLSLLSLANVYRNRSDLGTDGTKEQVLARLQKW